MPTRTLTERSQAVRQTAPIDIDARALEKALRSEIAGEVRFDEGSRALYSTDSSNYRQIPLGVVIPRTVEDVVAIHSLCRDYGAPITARGGGTSLSGQTCNSGVIVDFTKYLNRILEVDPEARLARVQPGLVLDDLNEVTRKYELSFGPDPSTHSHCVFGGMIGNNACGVHSMMACRTADNIRELEVVTYRGDRMRVGPTSEAEIEQIIGAGGRRGDIYAGLRAIRDNYGDLIREKFPKIPRRVSGFNLDELLPENGFQVARALVGTEGTCVTVVEATVELIHDPPKRSLVAIGFSDVYRAADLIPVIREFDPIGLEGMDHELVEFMKKKGKHVKDLDELPEGKAWLLVEFGGDSKDESDAKAHRLIGRIEREGEIGGIKLYDDPAAETRIWEVRKSGLGATAWVPGMPDTWPGWEDAAVHPDDLGRYLRDYRALLDRHGYDCALYGHFGQGVVHCRIDFDLVTHAGIEKYRAFVDDAADLVASYRGSFSAEHGDGQSKAVFLPRLYGVELVQAMEKFKRLWDPDWRMNPGKAIDPAPIVSNLRLGADYRPKRFDTEFDYPADNHKFERAALRCVGVGKCRRTHDAFMCPSYLVTREEEHSTRGRARLLFEMVRGDSIRDGWDSEAVLDSLDLCLSCKGCKVECPVQVDMATYKSEFLFHHYKGRLHPRHAYSMGLIDHWARLASKMPSVANLLAQTPPFSDALKLAGGISRKRQMPKFAAETFRSWFRRRRAPIHSGPPVVLVPDVFNDSFHPETLKAATLVLEELGYRIIVPRRHVPEVRPLIHFGMLRLAKRRLRETLDVLRPWYSESIPIIGLEPSSVAVYTDELTNLLARDIDAERLRKNAALFSDFVARQGVELPRLEREAILHIHCHHKAVFDPKCERDILREMGVEISEPEPGCCGLAGAFGFEEGHHGISMAIGEQNLLPAVRSAPPERLLISSGFSCRHQIEEGTGRRPLHLSQVILMAMREGPRGTRGPHPEERYLSRHASRLKPALWGALAIGVAGGVAGGRALARSRASNGR